MRNLIITSAFALALLAGSFVGHHASAEQIDRAELHKEIRSYLLENPEIVMEMLTILEERKQQAAAETDISLVADNADAIFDDGFSFVGGNPEGDFTIVEFLDYQCGYCRKAHPQVAELIQTDGNIRIIVKELPILGPNSELAARAALATKLEYGDDAYKTFSDMLMTTPGRVSDESLNALFKKQDFDIPKLRELMYTADVTEQLARTRTLAEALSISGTPTFVFGKTLIRGYVPLEDMKDIVAEIRADS